jgi:choline dehydrogenase-like flavoprotein
MRMRGACLYATPCERGCSIGATYQSTTVHLPPALASGNLDIVCDAMVREIVLDRRGRASSVSFIDKQSGQERRVRTRAVVLAAGACESVRILLNSRGPDGAGMGNSSGLVGKFIMDTVGSGLTGQIPRLESLPAHNEDGAGGDHLYAPWWSYGSDNSAALGFARGYHIEFVTGRREPVAATTQGFEALTGGSYGLQFKADMRRYFGSFVRFAGRGEMIPNAQSYCEIDPATKDRWGIPVLRFHWNWSDHETRQAAHMQKTFADIVAALGGRVMGAVEQEGRKAISAGGKVKHEVGGAMMGSSAGSSVTNPLGQLWDNPNVFVADGAVFCSNADKNPTLTIMALAWRSADQLISLMNRREI